jgi:hypothetical protein
MVPMKTIAVAASLALLAGCSAFRKAPPKPVLAPPPMCVQYDTVNAGVNYPTSGPRDQLIDQVVAEVDKHLAAFLEEARVPTVSGPCRPEVDTVMTVKIDRLEAVQDKKFSLSDPWATAIEARLKYHVHFKAPGAKPFVDAGGQYQYESLDDLSSKLAHRLYDLAIVRYPKGTRTGPVKRSS